MASPDERPLYAEARRALAPVCDGADSHRLGTGSGVRAVLTCSSAVLAVLALAAGLPVSVDAILGGLALGLLVSAGFGIQIDDDRIITSFLGIRRTARLSDVTRVTYSTRSPSEFLRLYKADGSWSSIPLRTRFFTIPPAACEHLARKLDRPSVTWEPDARQALRSRRTV
jgi:hypothetical protein